MELWLAWEGGERWREGRWEREERERRRVWVRGRGGVEERVDEWREGGSLKVYAKALISTAGKPRASVHITRARTHVHTYTRTHVHTHLKCDARDLYTSTNIFFVVENLQRLSEPCSISDATTPMTLR